MSRPALAAARAVEILNFLAAHPTESFTLSDLVDRTGVNVASLHALLAVLTESGYLCRHPRHRTYNLGPALIAVGSAALEQHPAIDVARDEIRRLSRDLNLDVALTTRAGNDVVFVARSGTHRPRGVPSYVGMRIPIVPPLASVFFGWSDPATVEDWLKLGRPASEAQEALDREELAGLRERGFSVALEGEMRREIGTVLEELTERPGLSRQALDEVMSAGRRPTHAVQVDRAASYDVSSISAPVFDGNGHVALAINLIGFAPGLSGEEVLDYGNEALKVALVVSKRTRGHPPAELLARVSDQ